MRPQRRGVPLLPRPIGRPRPPQCQRTSELWAALCGYYRLLNQPFRFVIIETQKAAFRVWFSRLSSPVLLSIILKEGRFSVSPYAITFTAPLLTTRRVFKTRWRSAPKGLHFTTLYTRLIIKLASHSSLFLSLQRSLDWGRMRVKYTHLSACLHVLSPEVI